MAKGCFRGCMGFARYGLEVTWGLLRVAWGTPSLGTPGLGPLVDPLSLESQPPNLTT